MYHQMCEVYFTSGIIKDMKIDSRNKWRKIVSLKLDTSIYRELMKELNTILISEFLPMMTWIIRISLSATLDI